jgi:hypothetical protein
MNQLIAKTNVQNKRSRVELKVEQKYMIIEYANQNPKLKQTQLIRVSQTVFRGAIFSVPRKNKKNNNS